jgi:hypothetical protein
MEKLPESMTKFGSKMKFSVAQCQGRFIIVIGFREIPMTFEHGNMSIYNRSFTEFGSQILPVNNLDAVENVAMRSGAEVNYFFDAGKSEEDKKQLPPAKILATIEWR